MNELQNVINKVQNLEQIRYNNDIVLTTAQVAEFYETDEIRIRQATSRNTRLIEGKHYHILRGEELKKFKDSLSILKILSPNTPNLTLWNKKGVVTLCKIINTDKAWDMMDILVESYFERKTETFNVPKSLPEALRAYADEVESHEITKQQLALAQPKAEFYDKFISSEGLTNISTIAKKFCNMTGAKLNKILSDMGIIFKDPSGTWMPYEQYKNEGYMKLVPSKEVKHKDGRTEMRYHMKYTPKGVEFVTKLLLMNGYLLVPDDVMAWVEATE